MLNDALPQIEMSIKWKDRCYAVRDFLEDDDLLDMLQNRRIFKALLELYSHRLKRDLAKLVIDREQIPYGTFGDAGEVGCILKTR